MIDWSIANDIAVVIATCIAAYSLKSTTDFEKRRRISEEKDQMRANLERAIDALGSICATQVFQGLRHKRLGIFKDLDPLVIRTAKDITAAKLMLLSVVGSLRLVENKTKSVRDLLKILGETDLIDTAEKANNTFRIVIDLAEQILAEMPPPSMKKKLFQRIRKLRSTIPTSEL